MNTFVVTKGDYSDYRIVAVFLDEVQANEYLAELVKTWTRDAHIEVWPTGRPEGTYIIECFISTINLETGEIKEGAHYTHEEVSNPNLRVPEHSNSDVRILLEHQIESASSNPVGLMSRYQFKSYVSQEHANKLASEGRQEVIRYMNQFNLKFYNHVTKHRGGSETVWSFIVHPDKTIEEHPSTITYKKD